MEIMIATIDLMRDAFGEEKFCYILVAELKDPPTTIPNNEGLKKDSYTTQFVTSFSSFAILSCRKRGKFCFRSKWFTFRNDGEERETCRVCFVLLHLFHVERTDNLCGGLVR